jgi:hypothetical protein
MAGLFMNLFISIFTHAYRTFYLDVFCSRRGSFFGYVFVNFWGFFLGVFSLGQRESNYDGF